MKGALLLSCLLTSSFCIADLPSQSSKDSPTLDQEKLSIAAQSSSPVEVSPSNPLPGSYGTFSIGAGLFQATNHIFAPVGRTTGSPFSPPSFLTHKNIQTAGPRITLEQVIGYKHAFALRLRGSIANLFCSNTINTQFLKPKGYTADADTRLFASLALSETSGVYLSPFVGFAWHQFYFTSKAFQEETYFFKLQYFMRYLAPIIGLCLEVEPSSRSALKLGISFFFPRGKQKLTTGSLDPMVKDRLRAARHGWSAEYVYSYSVSKCCSASAQIEYREFSMRGKYYHIDNETVDPQMPSTASGRTVLGSFSINFKY